MTPPPSDHFNGKTFFQGHNRDAWRRLDLLRWRLTAKAKPWPRHVALAPQPTPPAPAGHGVAVTWLGHASFLLRTARGNFLIDPVFSERASPFTWIGPRRAHPPPLALEALPRIDAVLVSHDHYDHLDQASLRWLAKKFSPRAIAPLRHRDLLAASGITDVVELDWWQSHALGANATVTLTPTKHWSNRLGTPRNHRLWGGFFLTIGSAGVPPAPEECRRDACAMPKRIWFAGDTGYDAAIFRAIRERCGAPDLALVPIGAYEPRWFMAPMHMNPAEAVQAHRDVGARRSLAMHWGTFQLSDEGREEPVEALVAARKAAGLANGEFEVVAPGGSLVV